MQYEIAELADLALQTGEAPALVAEGAPELLAVAMRLGGRAAARDVMAAPAVARAIAEFTSTTDSSLVAGVYVSCVTHQLAIETLLNECPSDYHALYACALGLVALDQRDAARRLALQSLRAPSRAGLLWEYSVPSLFATLQTLGATDDDVRSVEFVRENPGHIIAEAIRQGWPAVAAEITFPAEGLVENDVCGFLSADRFRRARLFADTLDHAWQLQVFGRILAIVESRAQPSAAGCGGSLQTMNQQTRSAVNFVVLPFLMEPDRTEVLDLFVG
jgi:hypothetical protein